jgi:glycosyltransferase involved in cell wall biosynthesis
MNIGLDGRFIQDHYPGIGRYSYHLALSLAKCSPQDVFSIVIQTSATNTRYDLDQLVKLPNVHLVYIPASPLALGSQWQIRRLAQRESLTLFHTPHYPMSYILPCPVVATLHDMTPWLVRGSVKGYGVRRVFWMLMRLAAWRSTAVITGSRYAAGDLIHYLNLSSSKVTVAPHGIDSSFHPVGITEISDMCARFKLDKPYLLYCGSNKPHKNLGRLLEAWAILPPTLRDRYLLVLAGAEDNRFPTGQSLAHKYGVPESTRVLGACREQDLPALYSGARSFIFPSLYEGFGLPVLEAMACGTAVACADNSSLPEVVGDTGLLFNPHEVSSISSVMGMMLSDSSLCNKLAQAGLERSSTFNWERTAQITLGVYRSLRRDHSCKGTVHAHSTYL